LKTFFERYGYFLWCPRCQEYVDALCTIEKTKDWSGRPIHVYSFKCEQCGLFLEGFSVTASNQIPYFLEVEMSKAEIVKSYFKWKAVATCGIWAGAGVACLTAGSLSPVVCAFAFLTTFIVWIVGSEIS